MNDLQGRVVLVTGAASGLGKALCRTLARAGAVIAGMDVQTEPLEDLVAELREAGAKATSLVFDVSDPDQVHEAVLQAIDHHGQIDVLVNNAGVDVTKPADELTAEEWERVIRVNLTGPFLMAREILPIMRRQGRGHIVNIASTAAKRAWANASAYHASKWGLLGLSHALHVESRPDNVKVTAVIVGGMRTPFLLERFPDIDEGLLQDPRNVAETIRYVLTQPDETVIPEVTVIPMRETSWP